MSPDLSAINSGLVFVNTLTRTQLLGQLRVNVSNIFPVHATFTCIRHGTSIKKDATMCNVDFYRTLDRKKNVKYLRSSPTQDIPGVGTLGNTEMREKKERTY